MLAGEVATSAARRRVVGRPDGAGVDATTQARADAPPAAPTIGIGDVDAFSREAATFTLHDVAGKTMREEWLRRWPPAGAW